MKRDDMTYYCDICVMAMHWWEVVFHNDKHYCDKCAKKEGIR